FPVEEKITSITWLHDGKSVVFTEPNEELNQVTDPKQKDRLNVTESYSLQLSNLTMADTGPYRAMISTPTSSLFTNYDLRLFIVSKVWLMALVHSTCNVTLRCSVEAGGENTIYGWTPMGPRALFPREGSVLSGSQNSCDLNWTYTCTAMNPVSKSISSLNLVPKQLQALSSQ
ncbi:hypothetical protein E2I00_014549, partial [Balaenoptera physalus]